MDTLTMKTAKEEEIMTDYQFRTIIKMVLAIATETNDVETIRKALRELLPGNQDKDED